MIGLVFQGQTPALPADESASWSCAAAVWSVYPEVSFIKDAKHSYDRMMEVRVSERPLETSNSIGSSFPGTRRFYTQDPRLLPAS
jgi:hypothetical protein